MTQTAKKSPFSMNVDLMHGPIFKNLLLFMLPIFISNLFQQLYNTVDTMIVGNVLGDTALAAIGSCGSIYELLLGFGRENIPAMMAAVVVISVPLVVLFLVFRKKVMAGVARGGTKG